MKQSTITRTEMQTHKAESVMAFHHVPGMTKWLHFTYDVGRKRLEYRLRVMQRGEETVSFFDDLDTAIAEYNNI